MNTDQPLLLLFKNIMLLQEKNHIVSGIQNIYGTIQHQCKEQNRVERKSAGERTILEEECASDKRHSAAYFCKAAAFLCPARSPAAGQGAEPSHANIRKINFSPQRTQLLEQKATQAIALWHFTYFWHDAGSPPLTNSALVLEQPEKKYTLLWSLWLHRHTQIRLWIWSCSWKSSTSSLDLHWFFSQTQLFISLRQPLKHTE